MIGEIHYWRDMQRVLEAINTELKVPYVETVAQILAQYNDTATEQDVKKFYYEKQRIHTGFKEANWNQKYMKIIEQPVRTIEQSDDLPKVAMQVGILLRSLENIFQSSHFYKEARMVSFLDRVMSCITQKIRKQASLGKAIQISKGSPDGASDFKEEVMEGATQAVTKFNENFFMRKHMEKIDNQEETKSTEESKEKMD